MSKKITEVIKEKLTPEDFKIFEEAVEKMIERKVSLKEEEIKAKYDELAEEYVSKKVKEETDKNKADLTESYDAKLKNIEKKVVTKLGSFLDVVVNENINDASIEKLAINEVSMPVLEGIKKVFANNYIDLDSDGSALLKAAEKKNKELANKLSETQNKVMESEERLEKAATMLMISEKTRNLTESQKRRVTKMFAKKKFDDVESDIDTFVEMVQESAEPKTNVSGKGTLDEIITEEDNIQEEKNIINETEENTGSFVDMAQRYLNED